ncbi:MAG: HAD hydrolase family protein [Bacteroidales bacterium]|nr:HAD hydrolase family protein [Bacteroidales bacterium]
MIQNYKQLLKDIDTFIFDYDGVFTDGNVILKEDDEPFRTINVKDAYALQLAARHNYNIAIITGGKSAAIEKLFNRLGLEDLFFRSANKKEVLEAYLKSKNISSNSVVYMGDDIPDYKAMQLIALPCCPADAAQEVKEISLYISEFKGGEGCVRDIIQQVLKIQNNWFNDNAFTW